MRLPAADEVTDLVWVVTGFIGDIVLATAAIELAAAKRPQVRQHVITTPLGAKVLQGSPPLVSRQVFDKKGRGALAAFRQVRAGLLAALPEGARPLLLQAHRSFRSSFLARYLGWPTITYDETSLGGHAAFRLPRVAVLHEAARIALLLEPLGVSRAEIMAARPRLAPLALEEQAPWTAWLGQPGRAVVGVAPGSVWATKRWTAEGFVGLIQGLLAEPGRAVVLLGSEAERPLATEIAARVGANSDLLLNLAGQTSLDDLRRLYPRLALLVANDSSPVHYASAFDTPTLALFGATVPAMGFGPLATRSRTVEVELACRPCSDHGPMTCPLTHFRCMRDLSVETVLAASRLLLLAP